MCVSLWFLACSKSYWIVHWGCWDHYNSGSTVANSRVILPLLSIFFLFSRSSSSLPPTLLFSFCLEITGNASEVCFIEHPSLSLSCVVLGMGQGGESTEREGNYGSLASERGGPQCQQILWVTKPDLLSLLTSEHAQTKHIQSNTHRESSNTAHQNTLHHVCDVVRAWKAEISYNRRNKTTPERDYQVQLDSRKEYINNENQTVIKPAVPVFPIRHNFVFMSKCCFLYRLFSFTTPVCSLQGHAFWLKIAFKEFTCAATLPEDMHMHECLTTAAACQSDST